MLGRRENDDLRIQRDILQQQLASLTPLLHGAGINSPLEAAFITPYTAGQLMGTKVDSRKPCTADWHAPLESTSSSLCSFSVRKGALLLYGYMVGAEG